MKLKKFSLRIRIFLAMILLVLIASILMVIITIYQYNEQANEYHTGRLERKENAIRTSIDIELLRKTTWAPEEKNLRLIFKDIIYDLSDINQLDVDIYNLSGELQISSSSTFPQDSLTPKIKGEILDRLADNVDHRVVLAQKSPGGIENQSSYTYIYDNKLKPIGILHLPYLEDNSEQEKDLREFLIRLGLVHLLMLLIAIIIAYYVSRYITRSIQTVSDKMYQTTLDKRNEKIYVDDASLEIYQLVDAYNDMVDQLSESATKLARSEREHAWREMAKQVAHEIKNPLTPMRLTVQSFEQRFNPNDPDIKNKVNEFSKSLIQQIDTMSAIASAFSSFAEMPKQKSEELNVTEVVRLALDIFNEPFIRFTSQREEFIANMDKTHLIRIVTNLVKNSVQALEGMQNKLVVVQVGEEDNKVVLSVKDNGKGIEVTDKNRVFEPKFTTKTSGMGLGLAMVKSIVEAYNGSITFTSEPGQGTEFIVTLPKN